jgi:hypothetical protein
VRGAAELADEQDSGWLPTKLHAESIALTLESLGTFSGTLKDNPGNSQRTSVSMLSAVPTIDRRGVLPTFGAEP